MKTLHILFLALFLISPATVVAQDSDKEQNPVLVTINGVAITQDELQHFITKQGKSVNPEDAIRELINVELISQRARNSSIMEDKTLNLELKRIETALIASTYLQQHLEDLEITEDQIKARYQTEYVAGNEGTEYNANHILVGTRDEANQIIEQLNNGAEFTELAKEFSTGPSGENGGSLGWFTSSHMVAPFSKATMELSAGNYSKEPVQTRFGWHVILLNETRKAAPPTLESVREKVTTAIAAESIKTMLEDLHGKAKIEFKE